MLDTLKKSKSVVDMEPHFEMIFKLRDRHLINVSVPAAEPSVQRVAQAHDSRALRFQSSSYIALVIIYMCVQAVTYFFSDVLVFLSLFCYVKWG